MQYYRNLYVSENLQKKKEKILDKMEQGVIPLCLYLVVLAQNRQNHLEFFNAVMLHQDTFCEKEKLAVVGLAEDYGGAVKLVSEIVADVLAKTGGADVRGYIEADWKEAE